MAKGTGKRQRLMPEERERQIVEGRSASSPRSVSRANPRAGQAPGDHPAVVVPLFPSKEGLVERVYHEVYIKRWQPHWEALIVDRGRSLEERLVTLYREYTRVIFNYEWVRIFFSRGSKA